MLKQVYDWLVENLSIPTYCTILDVFHYHERGTNFKRINFLFGIVVL